MANFAAVLLQCEKPLHHWSDALTSSLPLRGNRDTVKIWSQYLHCPAVFAKLSWTVHLSLSACNALAQNRQHITIVDILSRHDLFWWVAPEQIAVCLQLSGTKYRYFITGQGGLLVKVVGSFAVDPDLIPGTSQPRQKSGVGQETTNFWNFKAWRFNPIWNKQTNRHC